MKPLDLPGEWLIFTSIQGRALLSGLRSAADLAGLLTAVGLLHAARLHPARWLLGVP